MVITVLLLAAIGYALARYKDYAKKCQVRAVTSLEAGLKPTCPT